MNDTIARLARIPGRCQRDAHIIALLENWRDALAVEWTGESLDRLVLRDGTVLTGRPNGELVHLFHEIWLRRAYSPPGYSIKRGYTVLDIGANIGVFSIYAATRAPFVTVHSFEPLAENVEWLRKNIAESSLANIRVHNAAVAGRSGSRELQVSSSNSMVHSLVGKPRDSKPLHVNCVSLEDAFRRAAADHCNILKMDCEGSEYEILYQCSEDTLARIDQIVAEYHEGPSYPSTGRQLVQFLTSKSFRVNRLRPTQPGIGYISATRMPPMVPHSRRGRDIT